MTATMWGYGPKNEELTTRRQKREEEQAGQLGEVPLDFGVTSRSTNTTKKKQIEPPETGVTHITRKNVKEMLQRKVGTARSVHNIIKISKTLKLSILHMAISSHRNSVSENHIQGGHLQHTNMSCTQTLRKMESSSIESLYFLLWSLY